MDIERYHSALDELQGANEHTAAFVTAFIVVWVTAIEQILRHALAAAGVELNGRLAWCLAGLVMMSRSETGKAVDLIPLLIESLY